MKIVPLHDKVLVKRVEEVNNSILNLNIKNNSSDTDLIDKKNELSKLTMEINELNNNLVNLILKEEQLNGEKNLLKERSKYQANDQKIHENISLLKEKIVGLLYYLFQFA